MDDIVISLISLLSVCLLVAVAARRVKLPYTVGLVITGVLIAMLKFQTDITLSYGLIFNVILPPLIFEAALLLRWRDLRGNASLVLTLAIAGVAISAAVVAAGLTAGLGWPLASALVFGVLIAATDPVAVIALFKDLGVHGRLRLLVESESLLNDGVAAVFFALALAWAQAVSGIADATLTPLGVAGQLLYTTGGGLMVGLAVGGAAILAAGRTNDYLVETALTVLAAYGSFLMAEHLHMSGVLATVAAGLLMGNLGILRADDRNIISVRGREYVHAFWDFTAFMINSLVFLLIGLSVAKLSFTTSSAIALGVSIVLVLIGRALTVYPLCALFRRTRWAVPMAEQHILWWGGLRGALGLALALALPESLPYRNEILTTVLGVVAFSVVVQGLSMPWLMRKLGLMKPH